MTSTTPCTGPNNGLRRWPLFSPGIAIAVACLGLLALASFTALQRSKEISIRKVLGGTSGGIVLLLSKGYVRLMLMAFIAAVPISYFLLDRWLENFAFRITVGPLYFLEALIALQFSPW